VEKEFGSTIVRLYFVGLDIKLIDILFFIFKLLFLGIGFIFYFYFKDLVGSIISLLSGIFITLVTIFPNLKFLYDNVSKGHFNMLKNQIGTIEQKIGFMAVVKNKLEKLSLFLKKSNCRAIIFIDDLDRCTNDKAVDVLNAVKLLLAENNFYTFIAIDPRLIINAIENKYSNETTSNVNGYEFMDKIIQIPFTIPKMSNSNKENFILKLLNELKKIKDDDDDNKIKKLDITSSIFKNKAKIYNNNKLNLNEKNKLDEIIIEDNIENKEDNKIIIDDNIENKDKIITNESKEDNEIIIDDNIENKIINNESKEDNIENKDKIINNESKEDNEIIIDDNIENKGTSIIKNFNTKNEIKNLISKNLSNFSFNNNDENEIIIDDGELKKFKEYSRYFDSNGRRMKRIINMYMVSREYFNKKKNLYSFLKKFKKEELLPNVIFAEQWPYCLSMIIVYLENLLLNDKKLDDFKDLKIIDILNKLKGKLYLDNKWKKLSYNDSRIDKLELFLKHLDDKNIDCYLLFNIQKFFIFNLNPSIKSYILKDMNELKLNEIDINELR